MLRHEVLFVLGKRHGPERWWNVDGTLYREWGNDHGRLM